MGRSFKRAFGISLALLIPVLYFAWYFTLNYEALLASCEKGADHELMALNIGLAGGFDVFTGAYSRFGFHHPGPLYFYYYRLVEALLQGLPGIMGKHLLAQLMLNLVCVTAACGILARFIRPRIWAAAAAVLFLLSFREVGKPFLHDYWNPSATVAPMFLLIVSAALLSRGKAALLPWCGLLASLCIQAHAPAAPVAAGILVWAALMAGVQSWRGGFLKIFFKWALISLVLGLVLFLPCLIEAWSTPSAGNVGELIRFSQNSRGGNSLSQVLSVMGGYYEYLFGISSPYIPCALLITLWILPLPSAYEKALRSAVTIAFLLGVLSGLQSSGELYEYILRHQLAVAALLPLMVMRSLILRVRKIFPYFWSTQVLRPRFAAAVLGALFLFVGIRISPTSFTPFKGRCGEQYQPFLEKLPELPQTSYRIHLEDREAWPFAAGFALHLSRRQGAAERARICVQGAGEQAFDIGMRCKGLFSRDEKAHLQEIYVYTNQSHEKLPEDEQSFHGRVNTVAWKAATSATKDERESP